VRIDLHKRSANIMISDAELNERRAVMQGHGGFKFAGNQTPWQEIQRSMVDQFDEGMVLKPAVKYQRVAQSMGVPRDNH
jgi:dihydroxy-acid dehydratase